MRARRTGGGALAADAGVDRRVLRAGVLTLVVVLACAAALAQLRSPSTVAPSRAPLLTRHGPGDSATLLPFGLAPAVSAAVGASERRFWPVSRGSILMARGGGIRDTFSASQVRVAVPGGTVGLSLLGVGRGRNLDAVGGATPTTSANQVLYRQRSISQSYRNGPYGLEQGFTVARSPVGAGPVVVTLRATGSLVPVQAGSQVLFKTRSGSTVLRYGDLNVFDASGRRLGAHFRVAGHTISLAISDGNARYPLRIDPFVQQAELGDELEDASSEFGTSVALSASGNTALVGAPAVNAAFIYTRSGGTWSEGTMLSSTEASGKSRFGQSVALSAGGNTALIGGPHDHEGDGAAWVFTSSGSTWSQQGSKLTGSGEVGEGNFGTSAALSAEGNTALLGAPLDNGGTSKGIGAAFVFTRSGSTWSQQGPKLKPTEQVGEPNFGTSVALSGEGNTAVIGGPEDDESAGALWAFTRSGTDWSQQGTKLTADDELGQSNLGASVALSSEGSTAIAGGPTDATGHGAAWAFVRSGSTWSQQGPGLRPGDQEGRGQFGASVALTANGNLALIGAPQEREEHEDCRVMIGCPGATWQFTRSGVSWSQLSPPKKRPFGTVEFGKSVALSSEGTTALTGDPGTTRVNHARPSETRPPKHSRRPGHRG